MRASRWLLLATLLLVGCGSDSDEPNGNGSQLDASVDTGTQPDAVATETGADTTTPEAGPDTATADATPDVAPDVAHDGELPDVVDTDTTDALSPYACPINVATTLQTATVDDLHAAILAGDELEVVDVREPSETATGVIDGALLYPWTSGVLEADHASLPTGSPLYVICASGGRSLPASTFLVDQGHTCVFNVQGGMNAWKGAGYPTVTP